MRKFLVLMVLSVLLSSFVGCKKQPVSDSKTVKIGIIIPLSGSQAPTGEDIRNGFLLAQKQHGPTIFKYELIFEDDQLKNNQTITAAQKLINVDKVDVIFTIWTPAANAVAPLAEKADILHFNTGWDPEPAQKYKNTMIHGLTYTQYAEALAKLIEDSKAEKIACIGVNHEGFAKMKTVLDKILKQKGISYSFDKVFNFGEKDFRTILSQAKDSKAEYYLIFAFSPEQELIIQQMKDLSIHQPFSGYFDMLENKKAAEGSTFVSEINFSHKFNEDYQKEFGRLPFIRSAQSFDIYNLMVDAYEITPSRKSRTEDLLRYLQSLKNYEGAVNNLSISNKVISGQPIRKKIVNGEAVSSN
jgi:branched-chain amino acid transport system substrate-binding protein